MANDSSAPGFLAPTGAEPISPDIELDRAMQPTILGCIGDTALVGQLVKPRWQVTPATRPQRDQNWVSFGATGGEGDTFAAQVPRNDGEQIDVERDELQEVLVSFFGPLAGKYEQRFRSGIQLDQNRVALRAEGMAFVELQRSQRVPSLDMNAYVERRDVVLVLRRRTQFTYQVRALRQATGELDNEQYKTPLSVTIPS